MSKRVNNKKFKPRRQVKKATRVIAHSPKKTAETAGNGYVKIYDLIGKIID
jgi:hypothetical protein